MKALDFVKLSFENTSDDCLLQQGAGGGYGAASGGVTVKATRSSLNPNSKSRRNQAVSDRAFGVNSRGGFGNSTRRAAAMAKAANAASGTSGTGTFIAGSAGARKKNRGVRAA